MKFILCFFILILTSLPTFSQVDTIALRKIAVKKLISIYNRSPEKIFAENWGQGDPPYLNVIEIFQGLFPRYRIISTSLTYHHYNGPNLVFVWDIGRSNFLDTITVDYFNDILSTSSVPLNVLEKSILYCNIVLNESTHKYHLNDSNMSKNLFPKFTVSDYLIHKYKDGCCTYPNSKQLIEYAKMSNDRVFYLPYIFQHDKKYFCSLRSFHYLTDGRLALINDLKSTFLIPDTDW